MEAKDMEQPEKLTEEERNQRIAELKAELAKLEKPPHNDWHSWFHVLLNITLHRFLDRIKIETEHVLGVEPPRADFLILTEEDDLDLGLEIFRIFRKHNIIEFKSPDNALDERVLWKVIGYAGEYISRAVHKGNIPANEVTLSIFRDVKPEKLLADLGEHILPHRSDKTGEIVKGIYHVRGWQINLPFQIVVTSELNGSEYAGFRTISNRPRREDAEQVLENSKKETEYSLTENYRVFFSMLAKKNSGLVNEIRSGECMEELMDILKPEIDERIDEAVSKNTQNNLFEYVGDGAMSVDYAAKKANKTVDEFISDMAKHGYKVPQKVIV